MRCLPNLGWPIAGRFQLLKETYAIRQIGTGKKLRPVLASLHGGAVMVEVSFLAAPKHSREAAEFPVA